MPSTACRCRLLPDRDRGHGGVWRARSPADHRAGAQFAAAQPAAGDRRPAVLPAELRDAAVRHRFPQYRRAAAGARDRRRSISALRGSSPLASGWSARSCSICFSSAPISAPRSAPSRRTAKSCGLMGVDQRRIYLVTSAIGGALAGLAACLLALQYDVHPLHRQHVRPGHLHDLRAGRARQHDRRLHRLLHHQPDHRHRRLLLPTPNCPTCSPSRSSSC